MINQIIDICHTIVLDHNLWVKYLQQLNLLQNYEPLGTTSLFRVLNDAFRREGKLDFRANAPAFPEEGTIPEGSLDDAFIVRLAVETGATLVTSDAPLREELNSCGVQETYNLQIMSPNEALESL